MLLDNPSLIGIERCFHTEREVPFYDSRNQLLGEIDAVFHTTDYGLIIVEYKCHDKPKLRNKAKSQLLLGQQGYAVEQGHTPEWMWYVYEMFDTEALVPDHNKHVWIPLQLHEGYQGRGGMI